MRAQLWPLVRHGPREPLWWRARQERSMLRSVFVRSAWAQNATVVAGTRGEGLLWTLHARWPWALPATQGRWSGLASIPLVCEDSATVVAGRLARPLVWTSFSYFGRHGLMLCGGGPRVKGVDLVSPLLIWSSWALLLWWRSDSQGLWSGFASVPLFVDNSLTVQSGR